MAESARTWSAPKKGTHFGATLPKTVTSATFTRSDASELHKRAADEHTIWRRGFWVGWDLGFDAAYRYVDPEA